MSILLFAGQAASLTAQPVAPPQAPASGEAAAPTPVPAPAPPVVSATLPVGTPVLIQVDENLSTITSKYGDTFRISVLEDVMVGDQIVIPKGAVGFGEVTFLTRNGGFGKPGILGIELRSLQVGDSKVELYGRFREEGRNKNTATAVTFFAVGVFSGFIRGKGALIEQGRQLKARTDTPMTYIVGAAPPPVPPPAPLQTFPPGAVPADTAKDQPVSAPAPAKTDPPPPQ